MSLRIRKGCRVTKVDIMTNDSFEGNYKGHSINIKRDDCCEDMFYINVYHPNGIPEYDGYWTYFGSDESDSMRSAVEEALKGAMIIV